MSTTAYVVPVVWGPIGPTPKGGWILAEVVPREDESTLQSLKRGAQQAREKWKTDLVESLADPGFWIVVLRPRSGAWEKGEAVAILVKNTMGGIVEYGTSVLFATLGEFDPTKGTDTMEFISSSYLRDIPEGILLCPSSYKIPKLK